MKSDIQEAKKRSDIDIASVFDRTASRYDRVGPAIFSYFGNFLVEIAGIRRQAKVLDIGTGRGAVLFPAARKAGVKGCVSGIDISREMIRETQFQVKRSGLKNLNLLQMDAQHLAFADGVFDYVLCGFAIFFFPQPLKALEEFKRVLGNKGIIALTSRALDRETQWLDRLITPFIPGNTPVNNGNDDKTLFPHWHSRAGVENAMRTVGFIDIRVIEKQIFFTYQDEEEWWESLWTNGFRRHLETLTPAQLERFKTEVYKKLRYYKKKNVIRMPFRVIAAFGSKSSAQVYAKVMP